MNAPQAKTLRVHGTAVTLAIGGGMAGVLLRGLPGAGKSSLALRLMDEGGMLIADDQVDLSAQAGVLVAAAPENLRGIVEVRGFGLMRVPAVMSAPLALVADLRPPALVERLPEPGIMLAGITLPWLHLASNDPAAPAKIRAALRYARLPGDILLPEHGTAS